MTRASAANAGACSGEAPVTERRSGSRPAEARPGWLPSTASIGVVIAILVLIVVTARHLMVERDLALAEAAREVDMRATIWLTRLNAALAAAPQASPAEVFERPAKAGRIAFASPVERHLAAWRRAATVTILLLAATVALVVAASGLYAADALGRRRRLREQCARRAHLDLALNRGRCGLWTWDLRRGRIVWSASMFGVLDLVERPGHWTISDLQALMHPEDESLESIARLAVERRGDCIDVEFRMRAADGRWVWLQKRAELVEDDESGRASLVGIAFDVTDRKREAEASATADQRLRDAIEVISEAFVLWDLEQSVGPLQFKISAASQSLQRSRPVRRALRRSCDARLRELQPEIPSGRSPPASMRAPTRRAWRTDGGCRSTNGARATAGSSRSGPTSPRSRSTRSS